MLTSEGAQKKQILRNNDVREQIKDAIEEINDAFENSFKEYAICLAILRSAEIIAQEIVSIGVDTEGLCSALPEIISALEKEKTNE